MRTGYYFRRSARALGAAAALAAALIASAPAEAAGGKTITVNSTSDTIISNDGQCTLAEAVRSAASGQPSGGVAGECAAGGPGTDTIVFAIGASTIHTDSGIDVTSPVVIDGGGIVALDGANAFAVCFDFMAGSAGSTIKGMLIGKCQTDINVQVSQVTIIDNWIGTTSGAGAAGAATGVAVQKTASGTRIGQPGHGNLIGGLSYGISDLGKGTVIQGNRIGVSANGMAALANDVAINLPLSTGTLIGGTAPGQGNLISSSTWGIAIGELSKSIRIQRNVFGTDALGTTGLGNTFAIIDFGGIGTLVGGPMASAGNFFADSTTAAISLHGSHPNESMTITGNIFGLGTDGQALLGNQMSVEAATAEKFTLSGNLLANSFTYAVRFDGAAATLGKGSVNNCLHDNFNGISNTTATPVNLNGNWWGAAGGPNTAGADPQTGPAAAPLTWLSAPPAACRGLAPAAIRPADNAFGVPSAKPTTFTWAKTPGVTGYAYAFYNASGTIIPFTLTTSTSFSSPAPLGFGRYFWTVGMGTSDGFSWQSPQYTYDVTLMKSPRSGSTLKPGSMTKFTWSAPKPAPVGNYTWTLYSAPTCTLGSGEILTAIPGTSYSTTIPAGTHYWRIAYSDGANTIQMPCWKVVMP